MNLIFDIKKEPNKNKNINYNNNNNLIEKKNILQKNISILSSLNNNIINNEKINYNNNNINNYTFKRLSSKSNQNITTQSFKNFNDNNINNNNNKLTNSSFPNISFFFNNNKLTENEFFTQEKENNPFNVTNDSFFNLNNKNFSQSVYKFENIENNNMINNINNNNNINNINNNNLNNNNSVINNHTQKNIKISQKQNFIINKNNNNIDLINNEENNNNINDENSIKKEKFNCEHANCVQEFKTLKQKLNHHKKMSHDCKKDTIHLIKNINKLKKIINILYNKKKIFISNSLKEKYEKNIRKIPHHEYALLLTGYYLLDNL